MIRVQFQVFCGKEDFMSLNLRLEDKFFPYKIKNVNGINYFYNILTNAIFEMDNDSEKVFVQNKDIEEYPELKKFCENNFILKTEDNIKRIEEVYKKSVYKKCSSKIKGMTLMVSQRCNLRCRYCYGDEGEYKNQGEMELEIAIKALKMLLKETDEKDIFICFFGGEPLMNYELIRDFVSYLEKNSNFDRNIHYSMTTNLTLLNSEIKNFINDKNIKLTVSLDGDKNSNDLNRFYKNGTGIYDKVVKNINELEKNVLVRSTICPNNLDINKSVRHLTETLGFSRVAWAEADNLLSEEDYKIMADSYIGLIDYIDELIKACKYDEVKKYHMFCNILKRFSKDGMRVKGCGAGNNMFTVDIDGKMYPCHRFVGLTDFVIGDINKEKYDSDKEFLTGWDLANFSECSTCIARNSCGGGCVNQNYYSTGSIKKHSEANCIYIRTIHERILESYISLDDEAKRALISS